MSVSGATSLIQETANKYGKKKNNIVQVQKHINSYFGTKGRKHFHNLVKSIKSKRLVKLPTGSFQTFSS